MAFIYFFKVPCRVPKSVGKLLYLCHAKLLDLLVLWVDLLSVCGFVDRHPFLICALWLENPDSLTYVNLSDAGTFHSVVSRDRIILQLLSLQQR